MIVVHVDVDYFFAQVEEVRLGLPANSQPLGVTQNHEVASTNYAARKFGLYNRISVREARRLCPEIRLVKGNDIQIYRAKSQEILRLIFVALDELQAATTTKNNSKNHRTAATQSRRHVEKRSLDDFYVGLPRPTTIEEAHAWALKLRSSIVSSTGLKTSLGVGKTKLLANLATITAKQQQGEGKSGVHSVDSFSEEKDLLLQTKISDLKGAGIQQEGLVLLKPKTRTFLTSTLGSNVTIAKVFASLEERTRQPTPITAEEEEALLEVGAFLDSALQERRDNRDLSSSSSNPVVKEFQPPRTLSVECSVRETPSQKPATSIEPIRQGYERLAQILLFRAQQDERIYGARKISKVVIKWKFFPNATPTKQTQIDYFDTSNDSRNSATLAKRATEAFQRSIQQPHYKISRVVLTLVYETSDSHNSRLGGTKRKQQDLPNQRKITGFFQTKP